MFRDRLSKVVYLKGFLNQQDRVGERITSGKNYQMVSGLMRFDEGMGPMIALKISIAFLGHSETIDDFSINSSS